MCFFVAAAILLFFPLDVAAAGVLTATDPECASDESCEDTESDLVTLMQKTHSVSKHVTAKAIRTSSDAMEAKLPDVAAASLSFAHAANATEDEAKGPNKDMPAHVDETLAVMAVSSGEHKAASGDESTLSAVVSVPRGKGGATAGHNSTPSAFVLVYSGEDAAIVGNGSTVSAVTAASLGEGDATAGDNSAFFKVAVASLEKVAVADGDNSTLFGVDRTNKPVGAAHATVRMSVGRPIESGLQSEDVDDEAVSMMQVVGTERQKSASDTSHVHDAVQSSSAVASGNTGTALAFTIGIVALLSCIAGLVIIFESEQGNSKGVRKSSESPTDESARQGLSQYDAVGWSGDHPGSLDVSSRLAEAKPGEAIQSRRVGARGSASSVSPRLSATPPLFPNEPLPMFGEGAPAIGAGGLLAGSGQLVQPSSAYSALPSLPAPMVPTAEPIPALCPMLVLPACESHFAVPTASLSVRHPPHEFDILGLSLTPLLHAVVKHAPGGFCLETGMVQDYKWGGTVPRATVSPAVGAGRGSFEVMGQSRELFGTLRLMEPGSPARYVLSRRGQPLFTVCKDEDGRTIRVVSPSGAPVCSVGRLDLGGAEHLQFGIPPATDAVLVISCVLSTFLLTG